MIPVSSLWTWGELFQLSIPDNVIVSDREHAIEFVPALYNLKATPIADQREAARAWLTVFDVPEDTPDRACRAAIVRFAGSLGLLVPEDAVATLVDRGVVWGRLDFISGDHDWHLVAVAWNGHLALFFATGTDRDPAFAESMDRVIASWRPVDPVVAIDIPLPADDGF